MDYNNILSDLKDGILYLTINRESKMNALNIATIKELGNAIDQAYTDKSVFGVILSGAGDKSFIAGADISEFADFNGEQGKEMSAAGHTIFNKFENCPKPTIAAINGFALGGGLELAMSCHLRIASNKSKFGQPEVNLGVIPGYGATQRLAHLIGKGKAMELNLTGDMIKAEEATQLGLINHVTEPGEEITKAEEIIKKTSSKGPLAIARVIKCINAQYNNEGEGFKLEIEEFGNSFETQDFKEGTQAFLNKRKAEFIGE
jgi:enoyl-CoA hydratase